MLHSGIGIAGRHAKVARTLCTLPPSARAWHPLQTCQLIVPQIHHSTRRTATFASDARNQQQLQQQAVPWLHSISHSNDSTRTATSNGAVVQPPTDVDAILVLAGGQTTTGTGLPPWVERRLDTSLGLQKLQAKPCPIVCLGGGTPHKAPILKPNGYVLHESTACASYLIDQGADPALILKEVSSYDTVGNAYFSLTIHALPAGWRRMLVVTSDFHMPRSRALFQDMYRLAAQDILADPDRFCLSFAAASDEGLFDADVLEARVAKEAGSMRHWQQHCFTTFAQLHWWLHHEHQCYAVARQEEFDKATIKDPRLLASY